jgi:DNA polymerase-3 subunit delta
MDSMAFLERIARSKPLPLYVVHGDEAFLKREVVRAIRKRVLDGEGDDLAVSVHEGEKAQLAEVSDELETVPFFGSRRLVIVEDADPFVSKFRAALEKKFPKLPSSGVLVLELKSFPSNTRLYKLVADESSIICKAPAAFRLPQWCAQWCPARHGKQIANPAAALLVDLIGPEMGLLDQEMEKLAIYIGDRARIDPVDVDKLVGQSRAENTWKIFEAIGAGNTAEALEILDRLFDQGEEPMRLLGAFSMQLRRLAQAARLVVQGKPMASALASVGVPPFAIEKAQVQLKHLGRRRALKLYDGLLELSVGFRGGSPLPERTQLERFIVQLARPEARAATMAGTR